MTIIIRAQDKASEVAKKVGSAFQGQGDKIASAMERARQAGDRFTVSIQKAGSNGMSVYAQLTAKQQEYLQGLSKSQGLLDRMGIAGTRMGQTIQAGYNKVKNAVSSVTSGVESLKQKIASTTVGQKLISGFNTVKTKVTEVVNKIRTGFASALDAAKTKVESLSNRMGELGTAVTSVFGAIGLGSIYEATVGLAMTREQMTALMTATMGSKDAAVDFIGSLDTMTNSSLVSLNDLGTAMSKIKMSTGMTNEQLKLISPTVNDIGQRAILMGKSGQEASELMVAAYRGLNGEFDMLKSNFGITRQSLIDAGWSGAATDVEGYNTALQKVLQNGGDMQGMLESTPGQIALVKKAFSTAGRQIGEAFLPIIKMLLEFGLYLKETNPWVFKLVIVIGALIAAFAMALPVLGAVIGSFKSFLMFLQIIPPAQGAVTLSSVKDTAARWLNTASLRAQSAATYISTAAMKVYEFATSGSVIATTRATAAMIAKRAADLAGAVATGAATSSIWAMTAALLANPITWVVIAIIALVAILWHLYNTNETVRNAINGFFDKLKELGAYIYGGLVSAWNALTTALAPIGEALGKLGAAIGGRLKEGLDWLMKTLQPVADAFGELWAALSGGASSGATDIFGQIWGILQQIYNVIVQVANILWDTFGPAIMTVAGIIQEFFGAALQTVFGILSGIITFIAEIITILADLISGNITAGEALNRIWNAVGTLFFTVITSIINNIGKFAIELVQKGVKAAQDFLNGIVIWIKQLPGKIWNFLVIVVTRVLTWRNQMIARAKDAGTNFVNSVIDFIKTLPGKAWTWLLNTIQKIIQFATNAYNRAKQAGQNIINAIRAELVSLPGKMYEWGRNAVQRFIDSIIDAIPGLRGALNQISSLFPHSPPKTGPLSEITERNMYEFGESLGTAFSEGINGTTGNVFDNLITPTLSNLSVAPTSQSTTATIGLNTAGFVGGNEEAQGVIASTVAFANSQYGAMEQNVGSSWNNMTTATQTGFNTIKNSMSTILNQIVANNRTGYGTIQRNTATTMTALVTDNRTKYNTIQRNMSTTLTNITNDNKSKYATILSTTKTTLTNLQTKTNDSMGQVKGSWNNMRDSLVNAASNVKTKVEGQISHLSSNIGTFYRRIQNPILFLAGPMPYRYKNSGKAPVGRYAGGSPSISRGKFAGPSPRGPSSDQIRRLNEAPGIPCRSLNDCFYAGGWDYSNPWYNTIMQYVRGYKPHFGDLGNMGLTVNDFQNSTMPIRGNMSAFDAVARKLIGGTRYDFYFNSRYGSPYAAAASGAFNCYDGALIMLALANAFGLSGYMAHGTWGDVGHVWAVINGKTFDTTAYQGGYGWSSPKVRSAGPSKFTSSTPTTTMETSEPLVVQETIDLNLNIKLDGLPEGIDEKSVISILKDTITDSELIRKLVKDRGFQDRLNMEIKKTQRRNGRAIGQ